MMRKLCSVTLLSLLLSLCLTPHPAAGVATSGLKNFTEWAVSTSNVPQLSGPPVVLSELLLPSGTLAGPGRTADFLLTAFANSGYGPGTSSFTVLICDNLSCNPSGVYPIATVTLPTTSDTSPMSIRVDGTLTVLTYSPATDSGTLTGTIHVELTDASGSISGVQVATAPSVPMELVGINVNLAVQWADGTANPMDVGSSVTTTMMRALVY
jgi:hypothetical protein